MSKVDLESKVIDFIQRNSLIPRKETVVVAVSGGADSVCLLHLLAKWGRRPGIRLHAAQLNHQLRGIESEGDAEYVSNLTDSLGIPITIDRQDVAGYRIERKCSLEEAARELRYAFLAKVARQVGAQRIATGHTSLSRVLISPTCRLPSSEIAFAYTCCHCSDNTIRALTTPCSVWLISPKKIMPSLSSKLLGYGMRWPGREITPCTWTRNRLLICP
jgi:hypothetical protein